MATTARRKTAKEETAHRFQYAAKFICTSNIPGSSQTTSSFRPGTYQTAVNIHNPLEKAVRLRMKIAIADGPISKWIAIGLKGDEVTKVDCAQVREKFGLQPIHGVEGFLVIESVTSLDVTAVYTAGKDTVTGIDVNQIRERKLI